MDEAVDQVMARSSSETGADKAVGLRRSQLKERSRLQSEIQAEQKTITTLSEERAPIAAEVRKVEAEVGPIKYIAQFVYGESDKDLLEKAVTWVIIILIVVFDPLAVILLLASQISFQNFRDRKTKYKEGDSPKGSIDIVKEQPTVTQLDDEEPAQFEWAEQGADLPEVVAEKSLLEQHPYLTQPFAHFKDLQPMVHKPDAVVEPEIDIEERPGDYLNEPLFVQNEEQSNSGLWTKTAKAISQEEYTAISRQEATINEWLVRLRNKEITMADVPEHLLLDIRARR
jgi:hypothetical protein